MRRNTSPAACASTVGGLAFFLSLGSPQSKEESDPQEEKPDLILQSLWPEDAPDLIADLDRRFPGRDPERKL